MLDAVETSEDRRRWYVVTTHPAGEYRAREWLERRGYGERLWLPERLIKRQTRRKILVSLKVPLFPRYLFVALDTTCEPWHVIGEAPTVTGMLTSNGRLVALPQREVNELRYRLNGRPLVMISRFAENQTIRILEGPFAGFEGGFLQQLGDHIKVLLDILGRGIETTIAEALVEPA
jgi:transcriptional antiterminator RfaH